MFNAIAIAKLALCAAILIVLAACGGAASGQEGKAEKQLEDQAVDDIPMIRLERVFEKVDFTYPLEVLHAGDESGRLFVVSREGEVLVFDEDEPNDVKTYLDLSEHSQRLHNEEGLLSVAFHPDYAENGQLFAWFTRMEWRDPSKRPSYRNLKSRKGVLARYTVDSDDADRVDPDTEEVLLEVDQPFGNHNGGAICFGPDGYLYLSIGDGGAANDPYEHGQNLETLLGTVVRLDVDSKGEDKPYGIPDDNPFVGDDDALDEIWAYGLRNVWRMSFDPEAGDLWAGDVGQNSYEEVDFITSGGNYGWSYREGLHAFSQAGDPPKGFEQIDPVFEYGRDLGVSITGGLVVRSQLDEHEGLAGIYLVGDYQSGRIWGLRKDGDGLAEHRLIYEPGREQPRAKISSFGVGESGTIYVCSFEDAKLYKVVVEEAAQDDDE